MSKFLFSSFLLLSIPFTILGVTSSINSDGIVQESNHNSSLTVNEENSINETATPKASTVTIDDIILIPGTVANTTTATFYYTWTVPADVQTPALKCRVYNKSINNNHGPAIVLTDKGTGKQSVQATNLPNNTEYRVIFNTESLVEVTKDFDTLPPATTSSVEIKDIVISEGVNDDVVNATINYKWTNPDPNNYYADLYYKVTSLTNTNNPIVKDWTQIVNEQQESVPVNDLPLNADYKVEFKTETGVIVSKEFSTHTSPSTVVIHNDIAISEGTDEGTKNATIKYTWSIPENNFTATLQYRVVDAEENEFDGTWRTPTPNEVVVENLIAGEEYAVQFRTENGAVVEQKFIAAPYVSSNMGMTIGIVVGVIMAALICWYLWWYFRNRKFGGKGINPFSDENPVNWLGLEFKVKTTTTPPSPKKSSKKAKGWN